MIRIQVVTICFKMAFANLCFTSRSLDVTGHPLSPYGSNDIVKMKKIGLVGGLSWVSTAEYYRQINELFREKLGKYNSGRILLDSINEQSFLDAANADPSEKQCETLITESVSTLKEGGAEIIALCANGIHRFESAIQSHCGVSVINIAEATAEAISRAGVKSVGLLGVMKTMEGEFYHRALKSRGIELLIPDLEDRQVIHSKIIEELVLGIFTEDTQNQYLDVSKKLVSRGAEGVILGCTEIPLLLRDIPTQSFPLFSTTSIHCNAIVEVALG